MEYQSQRQKTKNSQSQNKFEELDLQKFIMKFKRDNVSRVQSVENLKKVDDREDNISLDDINNERIKNDWVYFKEGKNQPVSIYH